MSCYKLRCFDGVRGELIRLILTVGGVQFEDERIQLQNWGTVKPKMPQGHVPVLEVNGQTLPQSMAIARFIGKRCGLVGSTDWEEAQVDCILDTIADIWICMTEFVAEQNIITKRKLLKKYIEQVIPEVVGYMGKTIDANGSGCGFLVGSTMTIADLALFNCMAYPIELFGFKLDGYPSVAAHRARMESLPAVVDYLKNRQTDDQPAALMIKPAIAKCNTRRFRLTYSQAGARVELTQLAFAASGIEYEENRIEMENGLGMTKNKPQCQLPVLEVDGDTITQSLTIARFVGREGGLMGSNNCEQAQIEMVIDMLADIKDDTIAWLLEEDESKKSEMRNKINLEIHSKILGFFERKLSTLPPGNRFLVGTALSHNLTKYDGNSWANGILYHNDGCLIKFTLPCASYSDDQIYAKRAVHPMEPGEVGTSCRNSMIDLTRKFVPPIQSTCQPLPTAGIAVSVSDTTVSTLSLPSVVPDIVPGGDDAISAIIQTDIGSSRSLTDVLLPSASENVLRCTDFPLWPIVIVEPHGSESNTTAGSRFDSSLCGSDTDPTTGDPIQIHENEEEIVVEESGQYTVSDLGMFKKTKKKEKKSFFRRIRSFFVKKWRKICPRKSCTIHVLEKDGDEDYSGTHPALLRLRQRHHGYVHYND
ncbi:hypothetical protein ScPMuIL_009432 [Solemya velum]